MTMTIIVIIAMNNTDADLPILDTAEVAEFDMPAKETRPPVCDEDKTDQFDVIGILIRFSL